MLCISDLIVALFLFICFHQFVREFPSICSFIAMASDLRFEFCFHETIIKCGVNLLLGIIDPETENCHGTVNITHQILPSEKLNRKRKIARNKIVKIKKVFL